MVVIGLIGLENVGKKSFIQLFVNYLTNDEIGKGETNSEFNLVKVDINYDITQIKGIQKSYRKTTPNKVVFREKASRRTHTIFAPNKFSIIGKFKASVIPISRIANLMIPIFSFDQDIEIQLEFFKEIKFWSKNILICLNKYDLFEGDREKQYDDIEIIKKRVKDFFEKKGIEVIDLFLTSIRRPDSFHQVFDLILSIIKSKINRQKPAIREKLEESKRKEKYSMEEKPNNKGKETEIIYRRRDLGKDEHILKIIIEGDSASGNTTMLKKFLYNEFDASTRLTVGVQFFTAKLRVLEKDMTIQFWDFAGQKRWDSFQPYFYAKSDSMMIIFDLTRPTTLDNIKYLIESANQGGIESNKIILVGNKADLQESVKIEDEFALNFVEKYNLFDYIKTSAKTGFNIEYAFILLILIAMHNRNLIGDSELSKYAHESKKGKIIIKPLEIKKVKERRVIKPPEKTYIKNKSEEKVFRFINTFEEVIEKLNQKWLLKYEKLLNNQFNQIKNFKKIIFIFIALIILLNTLILILLSIF